MEVTIKHLKELGYKAYAYYVNLDFEEELHGRYADSVFSDFKKLYLVKITIDTKIISTEHWS